MRGFEWAENNFRAASPHEFQSRGVNVYFAPNISPAVRVVNLADGRVDAFQPDEERPRHGYYADLESLERYCRKHGIPLSVTDGQVSTEPFGKTEAGDPLRRRGR